MLALEVADRMLAEVASVDDAQQLINMAEMARVYARQSKLGTSAINHATVIKIRAERRLADIVDAGQANGEIASHASFNGNQHVEHSDSEPSTLAALGIEPPRLAEARLLRDAYSDEELAARQAEANERDEILSRQKLVAEARAQNEANGEVQRQRNASLFPVYDALRALGTMSVSPPEWAATVPDHGAYRVSDHLAAAHEWLAELREVWHVATH